jgi:hypothetical protein
MKECSFEPKVTPKSSSLVKDKDYLTIIQPSLKSWNTIYLPKPRSVSPIQSPSQDKRRKKHKYKLLYLDSIARQQRKKDIFNNALEKDCTFKP